MNHVPRFTQLGISACASHEIPHAEIIGVTAPFEDDAAVPGRILYVAPDQIADIGSFVVHEHTTVVRVVLIEEFKVGGDKRSELSIGTAVLHAGDHIRRSVEVRDGVGGLVSIPSVLGTVLEGVASKAAGEKVCARAADDEVVAVAADDRVAAAFAIKSVPRTAAADDRVVAIAAVDDVGAAVAVQIVVALIA